MTLGVRRTLRIPAELDRVKEVRALVRDVAGACGAPDHCIDDLVQAVDEATTNSIVHGHRGESGWVEVTAERIGDSMVVTIADDAPPFDPTTQPDPDLSIPPGLRRPGGMGIHLMRQATDRLEYAPAPDGGNVLTMVRRLDRHPMEERS